MKLQKSSVRSGSVSSAGHALGQIVGDWWEIDVMCPLFGEVATELSLFLDNRSVARKCRGEKVQWPDTQGNLVDYDFVLEINGTNTKLGIPVSFIESFWRRGARHSKDKARDDTNKLLPMRDSYVTARLLAIAACGEFTEPARDYVRSRNVELFYIGKSSILDAFSSCGVPLDYPDNLSESSKLRLLRKARKVLTPKLRATVVRVLREGESGRALESFKRRIIAALCSVPQEIRICMLSKSEPAIFQTIEEATEFVNAASPNFRGSERHQHFEYEVVFSDGSEFARTLPSLSALRETNVSLAALVSHMASFIKK